MKRALSVLLCICVLLSGCVAQAPASTVPAQTSAKVLPHALNGIAADTAQDFLRLPGDVSLDMLSPEYWLSDGADAVIMTPDEIDDVNAANAKSIRATDDDEYFALTDVLEKISGETVRAFVSTKAPGDPERLYLGGQPTTAEYWDALVNNANADAVPDTVAVRFGYSIKRSGLRSYTTDDFIGETPEDAQFDFCVQSEFMPYLPLVVLHESADREWLYVLFDGFGGWARRENVAICDSREQWLDMQECHDFLVVTGRELRICDMPEAPALSGQLLPMGTRLPLVPASEAPKSVGQRAGCCDFVVSLPVRQSDGRICFEYALIPASDDVSLGFLPYTQENVLSLAFKLMGDRYGWGGSYHANDCSGIVREIYACFGFKLPRTSGALAGMGGVNSTSLTNMTVPEKLAVLRKLPAGSLLQFPGHIMLYLGMRENVPYVLSAAGSFAPADSPTGEVESVNGVALTSLNVRRRNGHTWLEEIAVAVEMRKK